MPRRNTSTLTAVAALTLASLASAQPLADSQQPLAPFLGSWSTQSTGPESMPFHTTTHGTPGLGGQFVYLTTTRDYVNVSEPDQTAFAILRHTNNGIQSVEFDNAGRVLVKAYQPDGRGYTARWQTGDPTMLETIGLTEDGNFFRDLHTTSTHLLYVESEPAEPDTITTPPTPDTLAEPVADLSRFLGEWTIDATWADGSTLQARNIFSVGLNGQFMEATTFANDNNQGEYARYFSVYAYDADADQFIGHGFDFAGTYAPVEFDLEDNGRIMTMENPMGGAENAPILRQRIEFTSDDTYRWQVWMQAPGTNTFAPMMDGTWHRVHDAGAD